MSSSYRFTPQAQQDALDIALYIASDNPEAATRFLHSLENMCSQLAAMPSMGSIRTFRASALKKVRMLPVPTFENYLVFYRPFADGIDIIRVLHAARDFPMIFSD